MYSTRIMNRIRKNNHRRVFRNRMAGYVSSNNKHRSGMAVLCILVLLSVILLSACPDDRIVEVIVEKIVDREVILSTQVTDITINTITATSLTLNWTNPTDSRGFQGVLVSADTAAGSLGMSQQQAASATAIEITDLNPLTAYSFTLSSVYVDSTKDHICDTQTAMTATSANLPIDADGDRRIDITSLERLNNIRYNLDLGDGRYKTSTADDGVQCGTAQDTDCRGYELIISLDFANPNHYESGELNAVWRPQNSNGTIIAQAQADTATNSGWTPIGTAGSATRFNSRVEGNGHTIRNLYGRRSTAGQLGLFGATGTNSVIRSIGVATVRLYGSDGVDGIGGLVGENNGTIVASYASGTANGGAGTDTIGGLAAANYGTIVASYADGTVNGSANTSSNENIGGLVGIVSTNTGTIIASYANSIVNGGAGIDNIGGLIGIASTGSIVMASYASGTVNGNTGNDRVGGLIGAFTGATTIASYATATADGGTNDDTVGSIGVQGVNTTFVATYGFGAVSNVDTPGSDGTTPRPEGVAAVDSGIDGARMLTLATAGEQWNQTVITDLRSTTITTMDAWDFGTTAEAPALRYADYDGTEDTYGCGDGSGADIVIPSVVATPTGPMTISCGVTLLPEQVR